MHAIFSSSSDGTHLEVEAKVNPPSDSVTVRLHVTEPGHYGQDRVWHSGVDDLVSLFLKPDDAVALVVAVAEVSPELRSRIEWAVRCMDDDERVVQPDAADDVFGIDGPECECGHRADQHADARPSACSFCTCNVLRPATAGLREGTR